MSENSQDYAQKPQLNCTFMNSTTVHCTGVGTVQVHTNYQREYENSGQSE
jgi:hypothetical protein